MAKQMWVTEYGKVFNTQRDALDSEEEDHVRVELQKIFTDKKASMESYTDMIMKSPVLFIKYVPPVEAKDEDEIL